MYQNDIGFIFGVSPDQLVQRGPEMFLFFHIIAWIKVYGPFRNCTTRIHITVVRPWLILWVLTMFVNKLQ